VEIQNKGLEIERLNKYVDENQVEKLK